MALPPLDPVLREQLSLPLESRELQCPQFALLYRQLLTEKLDPHDASTRAQNELYEQEGIAEELKLRCTALTRDSVLARICKEICFLDPDREQNAHVTELDLSLRELCYVISDYIAAGMNNIVLNEVEGISEEEICELMQPQVTLFTDNLPKLSQVLSTHIETIEEMLKETGELLYSEELSPSLSSTSTSKIPTSTQPSSQTTKAARKHNPLSSRSNLSASEIIQSHLAKRDELQRELLPNLLSNLTQTLHTLLQTQLNLITLQIRHLETHTYSTLSRNLTTHATFLATVSQGIALKTRVLALLNEKQLYAEEGVQETLKARFEEATREEHDLMRRERDLSAFLREFAAVDGGEEIMGQLGKEYMTVEQEIEELKIDIEKLRQGDAGVGGRGRGLKGR